MKLIQERFKYMMQKIKYPVGSILRKGSFSNNNFKTLKIFDVSKNEYVAFLRDTVKDSCLMFYYTQKDLDEEGYTLSTSSTSPPPPPWKPKMYQEYWYMMSGGETDYTEWVDENSDIFRLKSGNVFRNLDELQKKRDEINSREI